jgi:protease IV
MRKTLGTIFIILSIGLVGGCWISIGRMSGGFEPKHAMRPAILSLKLEGIILDPSEFIEDLREYAKDDDIKGVIIRMDSPGGVVGPSQEIYTEIKRVRDVLKKPVVVSCGSLTASGAFYAAVAANQIYTNPGTLMGSMGVIMEFANLEKLYDWAKVQRYVIKTGPYKDSGAEYRPMRDDERALFQSMAEEILMQFKTAVAEGRKLPIEKVTQYADGRVFTGATAVKLGFADKEGTFADAVKAVGALAGLGEEPELYEPAPKRPSIAELFEELQSRSHVGGVENSFSQLANTMLKPELVGKPLFLMPGTFNSKGH